MRYVNPHTGQVAMYPNQQVQQPQMQQPTPTVVMTAQGPMLMTAQGMMPVQIQGQPQQQGVMATYGGPTMPMNPGMVPVQYPSGVMNQPGMNQAVMPQGRFSQPNTAAETMSQESSNRYQTFQSQQQQTEVVEEVVGTVLFSVKPVLHKFTGNEKFKLNVFTDAVKANNVNFVESHIACDCLEEIVECIIEKAHETPDTKMVTARNYIVNNIFYKTNMNELIDSFVTGDIKALYKAFKSNYSKLNDKYQINLMNSFNTMLTDAINDFLAVNATNTINIESFHTDFNDLLKVIRNNEEDLEDNLIEYLDKYITEIKVALNSIEKAENTSLIPEPVAVAYLDKHVLETGLDELTNQFVQVEDVVVNVFLNSLASEVVAKVGKQEFILVTMDKSIFKFMVNADKQLFIKKIA